MDEHRGVPGADDTADDAAERVAGRPSAISAAAFHRADGVDGWRVTATGPQAVFRAGSLRQAAALVAPVIEAAERHGVAPDLDVRPEGVIVRLSDHDWSGIPASAPAFAAEVARVAAGLGLTADPRASQTIGVYVAQHSGADARPFFLAAFGYQPLGDTDAIDPLRVGPQLAFNPISGDAIGRGRTHVDVFVAADEAEARVAAAIAAGGRLVDDSHAPAWWSLASPDNHGVDIAAWPDTLDV